MTPDEAFLRTIIENVDDDGPRLIYADWLEEHGKPERAEFIRVQIQLANLDPGAPEARPLRQRQFALLGAFGKSWEAQMPPLPEELAWGDYHRGFVEEVRATQLPELAAHTEVILNAIPLHRLALVCWQATDSLTGSPLLARARELVVQRNFHTHPSSPVDDPLVTAVLAWPELRHMTHLGLIGLEVSSLGVTAVAAAELDRLRSFHWEGIAGNRGSPSPEPLLTARWLHQLSRLEFEYTPRD
jgi:uncharacterized protein (TIGR02996 family)